MLLALFFLSIALSCLVYWVARRLPLPPEPLPPRRVHLLTPLELRLEHLLQQAAVAVTGRQFLTATLWAAVGGAALAYPLHNLPLMLLMAAALGLAPHQALQARLRRRRQAVHRAVEPVLVQISRCLEVRPEPLAAMTEALPALPAPLRAEFEQALSEALNGLPLPLALRSLAARCAHDFYLHQLAELVALHLESACDLGAGLAQLLERYHSLQDVQAAEAAGLAGWRWAVRIPALAALLPLPYWAAVSAPALQIYLKNPTAKLVLAAVLAGGLAAASLPYWLALEDGEGRR